MNKFVLCIATLDTKFLHVRYLKDAIEARGCRVKVADISTRGKVHFEADITPEQILIASGLGASFHELRDMPQNAAMEVMKSGTLRLVEEFYKKEELLGIISVGGGMGTELACTVMKSLPIGLPKVIICSQKVLQAGLKRYIDAKDIVPFITLADMGGSLNFFLRDTLEKAAYTIAEMVRVTQGKQLRAPKDNLVFLTVLGTVEECAKGLENSLTKMGYEVIRFYAGGLGTMEEMIREYGHSVRCVIELSLNEIGNFLFGGFSKALPDRLEEAGKWGIPQIVTCGNVNFVNFLEPETVSDRFKNRPTVFHNPFATLPRLNEAELMEVAKVIAQKLLGSKGPVKLVVPKGGFSVLDRRGGPLHDPVTDARFIAYLKELCQEKLPVIEIDANINDEKFIRGVVNVFIELMGIETKRKEVF